MKRKFSSNSSANMILAILIVVILVPLFFLFRSPTNHDLPPGPNTWQFLRTLSRFKNKPHVAFKNLAEIYGPLMSIKLGSQLIIVASSSSTAREILKTHDRVLSGRTIPNSLYYYIPGMESSLGMSRECNETWKFLREIFHKFLLSSRVVELKSEIRKEKVMEMMGYFQEKQGEIVKLDDILSATIGNILSGVLASRNMFDVRGGEKSEKVAGLVNEILEKVSTPGIADLFPVLKMVDFWSKRCAMDIHAKIRASLGDMIKEKRSEHGRSENIISNRDFLDVLVDINELSDDQISFMFMEMLMAGQETTVVATIWMRVELLRNQDVLHRVRKEIEEAIDEQAMINESKLSTCKYFQACIMETLRLHIPGPMLLPHRAIEKCKMNNYVIPKDSIVIVNAWAVHLDANYWNDSASFKPDRFLDVDINLVGNYFEFFPFSSGRRKCPGIHMAITTVQLVVASLIHYFDWSSPDGVDFKNLDVNETFLTTLKREKPLYLVPRHRETYVV